jgi:NAD(P)-dependent dehydrogenase (short-subunit alcohol dehydrogenase family)
LRTYVVTGAESGIGAATAALLRERGHRVIGVDRAPSDISVDLGTVSGREDAARQVEGLAPEGIAGFVTCAGIGGFTGTDSALLVSVNYFGAVELAEALRPLLARAAARGDPASVVLVSSNSVTCQPGWAGLVARACLGGDEQKARAAASGVDAVHAYPATKAALAWWARREGVRPRWVGAGVRVNAVAPGMVSTAMTEQLRADPQLGVFADAYPSALGRPARPEEIASAIAFLLSEEAAVFVGATLFADGGTDAMMHPLRPMGTDVL